MDSFDLIKRFAYHAPPDEITVIAHGDIREACKTAAEAVNSWCVDSREKSTAMTKLEEAMFWANACIARNGIPPTPGG